MRFVLLLCVALGSTCGQAMAAAPSFHGLGYINGDTYSLPLAVSADGGLVLGGLTPFRWTPDEGIQPVVIPGGTVIAATDVSADGTVIFGALRVPQQGAGVFRWSAADGLEFPLGPLETSFSFTNLAAAADDRTFAISRGNGGEYEAARWTPQNGLQMIGDFSGGDLRSKPYDISADGQTIVGVGTDEFGTRAFRWTANEGLVPMIEGDNREFSTVATGVSADGSVIVGFGPLLQGIDGPWRWTKEHGLEILTRQGEAPSSGWAFDVSDDGSRVVGIDIGRGAFLWTESSGILDIQDLLTERYGLKNELAGWDLFTADVISADGRTIAGTGWNPEGKLTGWVATVPEPAGFALALIVTAAACATRRARRALSVARA